VKTYRIALPALEVVLRVTEEPTHIVIEASYTGKEEAEKPGRSFGTGGDDEELKTWIASILMQYEDDPRPLWLLNAAEAQVVAVFPSPRREIPWVLAF
jgi:hypothetical protein